MLHRRPNTFAQTILVTFIFRLRQSGGPYIPVSPVTREQRGSVELARRSMSAVAIIMGDRQFNVFALD